MSQDDFAGIFDARREQGFGCALFDLVEDGDGRVSARLGPGWLSIEGQKPQRFQSASDLDPEVRWLTNLDKQYFWKSGAVKQAKLRHSSFLRVELGQLMAETGLRPARRGLTVDEACAGIAEIFARVCRLGREHYGILEYKESDLREQLAKALEPKAAAPSLEIEEACLRSWQELATLSRESDARSLIFRRPRLAHARSVLETPMPAGAWEFLDAQKLPPEGRRLDWLHEQKRPFLAKVEVKGPMPTIQSQRVSRLLTFDDALARGARRRERDWMASNELFYWAQHMRIEPLAVFMAERAEPLSQARPLLELGELSDLSVSLGLLAESHWMALAQRSRHPEARARTIYSPQAVFLRASDRFFCFASALAMQAHGFEPLAYGLGAVTVAAPDGSMIGDLGRALEASGLSAPAAMFETLKARGGAREGGGDGMVG